MVSQLFKCPKVKCQLVFANNTSLCVSLQFLGCRNMAACADWYMLRRYLGHYLMHIYKILKIKYDKYICSYLLAGGQQSLWSIYQFIVLCLIFAHSVMFSQSRIAKQWTGYMRLIFSYIALVLAIYDQLSYIRS